MKNDKKKLSRSDLQAEAISLFIAGLTVREIAKRLNSSPATISRITRQLHSQSEPTIKPTPTPSSRPTDTPKPKPAPTKQLPADKAQDIIDKAHTAVAQIIAQIQDCTEGETDVAKLANAADKLSTIAERITNLARLSADTDTTNIFTADFARRHQQQQKS